MSDFKTALVKIDTDLVLGKGDAEHLQQVKEGVENAIDSQIVQIENTNFELEELEKGTRWVDWVKKFGNQLDDLSSSSPTHRKDFLMSVVREVMVKTTDKQTHNIPSIFTCHTTVTDWYMKTPTIRVLGIQSRVVRPPWRWR